MALIDEVKSRYSADQLIKLSNPQDASATAIDDPRMTKAADDTESDFPTYLGLTFDLADARHVTVAVEGVIAKLTRRTGQTGAVAKKMDDDYLERLKELRERVEPVTTSALTPSSETRAQRTVRPTFDDAAFDDYVPESHSDPDDA